MSDEKTLEENSRQLINLHDLKSKIEDQYKNVRKKQIELMNKLNKKYYSIDGRKIAITNEKRVEYDYGLLKGLLHQKGIVDKVTKISVVRSALEEQVDGGILSDDDVKIARKEKDVTKVNVKEETGEIEIR